MTHIGPYAVERLIGSGGHAQVFSSTHPVLQRPVAVKVMRDPIARDAHLREQLVREARIAVDLHHPGIVTLYDVGQSDEQVFLVMELFADGSLADALQQRLPLPVVLDVAAELADALSYAHHQGIVHRDVKPSNVMLRANGTPVLVDFGLALAPATLARGAPRSALLGTPEYMAPEQIVGRDVDARTDIYQFGMLVYELTVGHVPFEGSVQEIFQRHLRAAPPALRDVDPAVPAALDALVLRMLAKDPAQRPADMATVAAELRAVRAQQPVAVFHQQRGTPAVTGPTVRVAAPALAPAPSGATATTAPVRSWHRLAMLAVVAVLGVGLSTLISHWRLAPSDAEASFTALRSAAAVASTTPVATPAQMPDSIPVPRMVTPVEIPVVSELPLIDPQVLEDAAERWTLGSVNVFQDATSIRIYGVVRNDNEETRHSAQITVWLREHADTMVSYRTESLHASVQSPGDSGAFAVTLRAGGRPLPREGRYAIRITIDSIRMLSGEYAAQRSLPVAATNFGMANDGSFTWSTTVGGVDQPVWEPKAFAVFFDEQDRVVGVAPAYSPKDETAPIAPGDTRVLTGQVASLEKMPATMAVLTEASPRDE